MAGLEPLIPNIFHEYVSIEPRRTGEMLTSMPCAGSKKARYVLSTRSTIYSVSSPSSGPLKYLYILE